jgi:8-oxo-dGTP pyrophosphatase MutT (NUDIX family)
MEFTNFLKIIPKIAKETLPAINAHIKMIPPQRLELINNTNYKDLDYRKAAVLMLLYPKNSVTHLALILRNSYPSIHASQIAFPGGKVEKYDASLAHTALRETEEEIGIDSRKIEIIKPFTEIYIPPSNFLVSPFLGYSNEELSFTPSPSEVAQIIELPLSVFLKDEIVVTVNMSTSYANNMMVPAFQVDEHIVWGATAMMMSELKETIKKAL